MTKADLINEVHGALGGSITKKDTGTAIQAVFDALADAIRTGGRFAYPDFGTFKIKERAARKGRNPRTGTTIKIKASKNVSFKPAPKFKDNL